MKKKQNNKRGLGALIVALLAIVVLIVWLESRLDKTEPAPPAPAEPVAPLAVLVKGCLFDLGLNETQVRFSGSAITVNPSKKISAAAIRRSFAQLEGVAQTRIDGPDRLMVSSGSRHYEVVFVYSAEKPVAVPVTERPVRKRLAIIIDDIGLSMQPVKALAAIDADLTFSVLPMQPHSSDAARYVNAKGREVILHLPMEGHPGANPGTNAIYASMAPAEIRTIMHRNFRAVPYVMGANNHMGSEATQRYEVMAAVMDELRKKDLFFVDSLTTSRSVCRKAAGAAGVPCAARDVFLDNERNYAYIKGQLDKLVALADMQRRTIGIGHPYPETIAVLEKELPALEKAGVQVVRVSEFMKK